VITVTAGTMFVMWIGEQITDAASARHLADHHSASSRASRVRSAARRIVRANEMSIFVLAGFAARVWVTGIVYVESGSASIPVPICARVVGPALWRAGLALAPEVNTPALFPPIFAPRSRFSRDARDFLCRQLQMALGLCNAGDCVQCAYIA